MLEFEAATDTKRAELGQFLSPPHVADLMASFFDPLPDEIELLDPGAGAGALTAAIVRRVCSESHPPQRIRVTVFEVDTALVSRLENTLADCKRLCRRTGIEFSACVRNEDFIEASVPVIRRELFMRPLPLFNLAIVNPPYRKIRSDSHARLLLRSAGIETVNLYTAFLALVVRLLSPGGQLVSITPRSFCNGPYFRPFREDFLSRMSLRRLHVFESRSAAFSGDGVLQENVILHAVKYTKPPATVVVSTSSGAPGCPLAARRVAFSCVLRPGDRELFIHLPAEERAAIDRNALLQLPATLADLGISVSTGRVVDFRARPFLRLEPSPKTAPLIYPCHFNGWFVRWPKRDARKPNAILRCDATADLLVPAGVYVLVRRFSAKEERRRLLACIFDPHRVPGEVVGFENHLNYFHAGGRGLPMILAKGLTAFLNSTSLDLFFREFSGHTQVNATDLRVLRYPRRESLERLGGLVPDCGLSQGETDMLVERVLL